VHAYAFLAEGAVAPLSGFRWPSPKNREPGPWVDKDTAPAEALRGCRADDLRYWLDDELWNIELGGTLSTRDHLLLAERARLVDRIESWNDPLAWEFMWACARRVAQRAAAALRDDGRPDVAASLEAATDLEALERAASAAVGHSPAAGSLAGYAADACSYALDAGVAARGACVGAKMTAFALAGDESAPGHKERLANERARQAAWLTDRLGLSVS
jgi:hypothetical protein